jgi:hypothetical protein
MNMVGWRREGVCRQQESRADFALLLSQFLAGIVKQPVKLLTQVSSERTTIPNL